MLKGIDGLRLLVIRPAIASKDITLRNRIYQVEFIHGRTKSFILGTSSAMAKDKLNIA
tara:strand:+ start:606 stop:779 length:174 start_codon:yes stop_codon:yes gene_type:complete